MGSKNAGVDTLVHAFGCALMGGTMAAVIAGGIALHRWDSRHPSTTEEFGVTMQDKGVCVQATDIGPKGYKTHIVHIIDARGQDRYYPVNHGGSVEMISKPFVERRYMDHAEKDIETARQGPAKSIVNSLTNAGIDSLVAEAKALRANGAPNVDCLEQYKY